MLDKITKNVGEVLDFPPDVSGNGPRVTIIGHRAILVENYREIIDFTEEEIRIDTTEGVMVFRGKGFVLKVVLVTELRIEGELASLTYGEGSELK